jgi:hypothetical protein
MSHEALRAYERARNSQLQRNEARHIRTRVHEARQAPHIAAVRWPFELLQNALDAGPRAGRASVAVTVQHRKGDVVFEHDGAPFSSEELAALLSGGSSKVHVRPIGDYVHLGRLGLGPLWRHDAVLLHEMVRQVHNPVQRRSLLKSATRHGAEGAPYASRVET